MPKLRAVALILVPLLAACGTPNKGADPVGARPVAAGPDRQAAATATNSTADFAVGVIPQAPNRCPTGSDYISIYMDDEDHNNASTMSGWTGSTTERRTNHVNGTELGFCRVDGTLFPHLGYAGLINWAGQQSSPQKAWIDAYSYSVLQLGTYCPNGSTPWSRSIENEEHNNQNQVTGNIGPSTQSQIDHKTVLHFCLFTPIYTFPSMADFPDIGVTYGVFGGGTVRSTPPAGFGHRNYWITKGTVHTDDEDGAFLNYNGNTTNGDSDTDSMNAHSSEVWGGKDTDFFIARVRDRSDLCTPAVHNYDGTVVTASYDGANCFVSAIPSGATGTVSSNKYYLGTAGTSHNCALGMFDGANCRIMAKPPGSLLLSDEISLKPGPNHTCTVGTLDHDQRCVLDAAPGTTFFEQQGKYYETTLPGCQYGGTYQGGHCYLATAPPGRVAFVYQGAFYYGED